MKWIDDQDDYFLRDFNSDGDKTTDNAATEFTFPSDQDSADSNATPSQGAGNTTRSRRHRRLAWFLIIVFAILAIAFYIRYFVPYTSDTVTTGYVTLVEKRGIFFKTFEGEMISESLLADTSKVYSRDFFFSIPNDSLGRLVQTYQGTGKRVTITTQKYFGTLPWRGSQKSVVTSIRKAD